MDSTRIVIGTRASKLALWQSHHIRDRLLALDPALEITLERISTRGDEVQDRPLAAIGRNSLFVAEIEDALRSGRIRLAVHSAKDLPSTLPAEFAIVAFTTRADPRDVLVSKHGGLMKLPHGAKVGTSSPRRACQLKAVRPDLVCLDIRGNVDTRLAKLDRGDYDAIVLAGAGLDRLGWSNVITERLEPTVMLPAVAQGILAVEARADDSDMARLCAALEDPDARAVPSPSVRSSPRWARAAMRRSLLRHAARRHALALGARRCPRWPQCEGHARSPSRIGRHARR